MSRYAIRSERAFDATAYFLTDADRQAEAVIYPELGFNCVRFRTTPDIPNGAAPSTSLSTMPTDVFVPPDDVRDLRKVPFHGGNPILFPFPNRVRNGAYSFEGRAYHMEKLLANGWDRGAGQAIHGLVGDKPWTVEIEEASDDGAFLRASLQLDAFPDIAEQYPFPCRLTVAYRLRAGVLEMTTEARNTGAASLPMGFGIHPWFPTALRPGAELPAALGDITPGERAQALVHVPASAYWELDGLMPTGKVVPVTENAARFDLRGFRALDGLTFDDVFTQITPRADGWSEGGLRDPQTGLEFVVAADPGFREWVLYAPDSRPVVALEPYTCTTDAVNLQPQGLDAGLIALHPGETWTGVITFGLRQA